MRTQSPDTDPAAERVQIRIMQGFTPARKFTLFCNHNTWLYNIPSARPRTTSGEVSLRYGKDWAKRLSHWQKRHPGSATEAIDMQTMILAVCQRLAARHIPFALAGMVACGVYGLPSAIHTIELVVEYPRHINIASEFIRHGDDYLDARHLFRVRISHDAALTARATFLTLVEDQAPLPILPPEDVAIQLLHRFKATGGRDDALYNDLLGMLKVQAPALDVAYLKRHSIERDVLALALDDAGVAA